MRQMGPLGPGGGGSVPIPLPTRKTSPKTILITGGAGFLGSHLCERLLAAGHRVICLDDFSTGRFGNIDHLKASANFSVVRHDVAMPVRFGLIGDVDEIYNLASPASPVHYQADPVQTTKTSVLGAVGMLELAAQQDAKIFQASTSEVYGDPLVHPQPESYWGHVNPNGPRACYDEGKRCAESLFFDFARCYGTRIKVGRIFNTYGPRMRPDDGRVVSNFIVQALRGEDLTIYGDGSQTRSFCYVDDLIEAFVRLMATEDDVQGPLNLGNPGEFTVRELAEIVIALTGSRSQIRYLPLPKDDPRQRKPNIEQAKALLDWEPKVALQDGLASTIAYFDGQLTGAHTPAAMEVA